LESASKTEDKSSLLNVSKAPIYTNLHQFTPINTNLHQFKLISVTQKRDKNQTVALSLLIDGAINC
jgi:hypothetical protein